MEEHVTGRYCRASYHYIQTECNDWTNIFWSYVYHERYMCIL